MNTTITARIMFIDADDSRITEKFLEDIGWIIPKGRQKEEYKKHVLEGEEVFIEFHILPYVIFRLKERGFDDNGTWFVKRISDKGVMFYLIYDTSGVTFDALLFVPWADIVSVHTVDRNRLDRVLTGQAISIWSEK